MAFFGLFGKKNKEESGPSLQDLLGIIDQYTYKPQFTGQTESGLFDLFNSLSGKNGTQGLPFDLGTPTTGLYDSLTRGIQDEYLGTPGGPEGGRIADLRAYYNNLGIPEQAINQERLANKDLSNSLIDAAAQINESQKNRFAGLVGVGAGVGTNLYAQNLNQQTNNTKFALGAVGKDLELQESIRQANQGSLNDLFGGAGQIIGTGIGAYFGGPAGASFGGQLGGQLSNSSAPNPVSRSGNSLANPYGTNYSSIAKLIK